MFSQTEKYANYGVFCCIICVLLFEKWLNCDKQPEAVPPGHQALPENPMPATYEPGRLRQSRLSLEGYHPGYTHKIIPQKLLALERDRPGINLLPGIRGDSLGIGRNAVREEGIPVGWVDDGEMRVIRTCFFREGAGYSLAATARPAAPRTTPQANKYLSRM